jgi:phosphonopyruvate decarboxylase
MISVHFFIEKLHDKGIDFFTGVPDSLLKDICAYITEYAERGNNIIAVNEGAAIALAAGYYLASGKIPLVYMQNSGLGNAVNPLLSLIDREIYSIPVLLLIGWRGEPGTKDETQHIKQGRLTIPLLDCMEIKYVVLSKDADRAASQIDEARDYMERQNSPYAFVVQKNTFDAYLPKNKMQNKYRMSREEALKTVAGSLGRGVIVVSTTGMISRELFEYREKERQINGSDGQIRDFLVTGSMGHASHIALGIALKKKNVKVCCFDGDGAVLMHMGALAAIGAIKPHNFIHIVFNNGAHDSVGGQPTAAPLLDLYKVASASGYQAVFSADTQVELASVLQKTKELAGPLFIEIKVRRGARDDLGRPNISPADNKKSIMRYLNDVD